MLKQKVVRDNPGAWTIYAGFWGLVLFCATSALALIWEDSLLILNIVFSLTLFALGFLAFVYSFWLSAQRSRREVLSVVGIYFLAKSAPLRIAVYFRVLLILMTCVALTVAGLKPFTGQAFGILAPLFILGLTGVWGARWGEYPLIKNDQ